MPVLLGLATGLMFSGIEIEVGVKLRPFDFLMLPTVLLFLLALKTGGLRRPRISGFIVAALAYGFYLFANAAFLVSMETALRETIQYLFFLIFFCTTTMSLVTARATQRYVLAALFSVGAVSLANAGYHVSQGIWSGWKGLDEPKLTHSLLVVLLAACLGRSRFGAVAVALALALMVTAGERKGWIAAGAALGAMALLLPEGGVRLRRLTGQLAAFAAVAVVVVTVAPYVPYLDKQLTSSRDFARYLTNGQSSLEIEPGETTLSNRARLFGIEISAELYNERPIFGQGLDSYKETVLALDVPDLMKKGAHNEVMRVAAELGTVGLALYGLLHLAILFRLGRTIAFARALDGPARIRARLGLGLFVYGAVANLFLGGGGVNLFLIMLPAALIYSVPLRHGVPVLGGLQSPYGAGFARP